MTNIVKCKIIRRSSWWYNHVTFFIYAIFSCSVSCNMICQRREGYILDSYNFHSNACFYLSWIPFNLELKISPSNCINYGQNILSDLHTLVLPVFSNCFGHCMNSSFLQKNILYFFLSICICWTILRESILKSKSYTRCMTARIHCFLHKNILV